MIREHGMCEQMEYKVHRLFLWRKGRKHGHTLSWPCVYLLRFIPCPYVISYSCITIPNTFSHRFPFIVWHCQVPISSLTQFWHRLLTEPLMPHQCPSSFPYSSLTVPSFPFTSLSSQCPCYVPLYIFKVHSLFP